MYREEENPGTMRKGKNTERVRKKTEGDYRGLIEKQRDILKPRHIYIFNIRAMRVKSVYL